MRFPSQLAFCLGVVNAVLLVEDARGDEFDEPSLGVQFIEARKELLESFGVEKWPAKGGMIIVDCDEKSPAYKAGLRNLDFVTHINGNVAMSEADWPKILESLTIGKAAPVVVRRPVETKGGIGWRRGTVKVTPISKRDFLTATVVPTEAPGGEGVIYRHHAEEEGFLETDYIEFQLVEKNGELVPALKITEVNDLHWLFTERVAFEILGRKIDLEKPAHQWGHHNDSENTWEWTSFPCLPKSAPAMIVKAVRANAIGKIHLHGDDFVKEAGPSIIKGSRIVAVADFYKMRTGNEIE